MLLHVSLVLKQVTSVTVDTFRSRGRNRAPKVTTRTGIVSLWAASWAAALERLLTKGKNDSSPAGSDFNS